MKFRFLLVLTVLPYLSWSQNEKITVTDLTRLKAASGVSLSPDGSKAIYAVQTTQADDEKKWEYNYRTHLWITDFKNPARQLTQGEESVGRGIWKDEKTLLFMRPVKGKLQLFQLSLDGGEPKQLTNWKYGIGAAYLSPDHSKIAFSVSLGLNELLKDSLFNPTKTVPQWSFEKPGFRDNNFLKPDSKVKPNPDGSIAEIRAFLDQDVVDKKAKVINRLNFQGEATTQPELTFSHICLVELKEGAQPKVLTTGFKSVQPAGWSTDGKVLFATTGQQAAIHPDREQTSKIIQISPETGEQKDFFVPQNQRAMASSISKDGKKMIVLTSPAEGVNLAQVNIINTTGEAKPTPISFDRAASGFVWSNDSKYVYFTAASNGGEPLYRINAATNQVETLSDFDSGILDFDLKGDKLIFVKTQVTAPNEVYWTSVAGTAKKGKATEWSTAELKKAIQSAQKLTNLNDWVSKKAISIPEKRTFQNEKGQTIEYWIMKPAQLQAGKKYPLLLNMHGGPTAMWGPGEASMWHEFQFFCSQGYGVVYANPRGSGGYGIDFQRGNIKDWGTGPASDVLRAATEAAKESWADTSRQVITGGSYAGYLTAWIVGHDHRFKAAFSQRGVYDLTTFLGEGNAWRLVPNYFQYPWLDKKDRVLEANSPYTFVDQIRTPLLIKHGENDLRTGVIQSEMMYKSMKIMGKDVEYVRMPGATHELSRSGNVRQRIDRMLRIYEFFERYIGAK
ncbi:S9 family peptidase [Siphonobacter sp. SORGH_AS_0500]|uniref:S9 family peptidase n=1 Tax=Siphonobacter sp. SORGH_AS_0500 TaxID=1864824 RepID=UPI0028652212|nr:S9 family peptidase [Siphonobacter sp. SORGH_AS_0500]MDR6195805.1 dipeptidyl aminopeptidase/acylaminoacyl peptidase [Siphonobacter sp. SORGH_AS_0500]